MWKEKTDINLEDVEDIDNDITYNSDSYSKEKNLNKERKTDINLEDFEDIDSDIAYNSGNYSKEKNLNEEIKTDLSKKNEILLDVKFGVITTDWTVNHILKLFEDEDLDKPDYQRDFVWTDNQKSSFIETILLDFPIPSIFISKYAHEKYHIIDGLQRLSTIKWFSENSGNKIKSEISEDWNKKVFANLDVKYRKIFERKSIPTIIIDMESGKHPENLKAVVLADIFARINTGGTKLTSFDIRRALYFGEFMNFLVDFSTGKDWEETEENMTKAILDRDKGLKNYSKLENRAKKAAADMILRILFVFHNIYNNNFVSKAMTTTNLNLFCGNLKSEYEGLNRNTQVENFYFPKSKILSSTQDIKDFLNIFYKKDKDIFRNWSKESKYKGKNNNKLYIEAFVTAYLLNKNLKFSEQRVKEFKEKYVPGEANGNDWINHTNNSEKINNRVNSVLDFFKE